MEQKIGEKRGPTKAFGDPKYEDYNIYGDAAIYQNESYRRYQDYARSIQCNIAEAKQIHDAFEDGYNGNFNGGKGKMMKGGNPIEAVQKIGQKLRDLLMPESTIVAIPDAETIFNDFKKLADRCQKELVSFLIRNKIIESSLEYGSKFVAILLFTKDSVAAGSLLIQEFLDRNNITFSGTVESLTALSQLIVANINDARKKHTEYIKGIDAALYGDLIEMIEEMKKGLPGSEERVEQEQETDKMEIKFDESKLESMGKQILKIQKKTEFINKQNELLEALNAAKKELEEAKDAQTELTGDEDGEKESADNDNTMNVEYTSGGQKQRKTSKGGRKCSKSRKGNCKTKVKSRKNKRRSNKKKYNKKYNKK